MPLQQHQGQSGCGTYAGSQYQYGSGGGGFHGTPYQYGGFLPAYSGTSHQYGFGLGDILRGVFRTIVPYIWPFAKHALSGFAVEASRNLDEHKPFGESVRGAIMPALKAGLGGVVEEANRQRHLKESGQSGEGKRRRVYKTKKKKSKSVRSKLDDHFGVRVNF